MYGLRSVTLSLHLKPTKCFFIVNSSLLAMSLVIFCHLYKYYFTEHQNLLHVGKQYVEVFSSI